MNEDGILYYLFLFFANLGIFVSLTTFMVLKGWIPYPGGESQPDTDQVSQQSSETESINNISVLPVDSAGGDSRNSQDSRRDSNLAADGYSRIKAIPNATR